MGTINYNTATYPVSWSCEFVTVFSLHLDQKVNRKVARYKTCNPIHDDDHWPIHLVDNILLAAIDDDELDKINEHSHHHESINNEFQKPGFLSDVYDIRSTVVCPYSLQGVHSVHHKQRICIPAEKIRVYWHARQPKIDMIRVMGPCISEVKDSH